MNISTVDLLKAIDAIECDMRSLEGRLTGLRMRIHDGRRDVGVDGRKPEVTRHQFEPKDHP